MHLIGNKRFVAIPLLQFQSVGALFVYPTGVQSGIKYIINLKTQNNYKIEEQATYQAQFFAFINTTQKVRKREINCEFTINKHTDIQ